MRDAGRASGQGSRGRAFGIAVASILLLMWPALVNRQPFFFSDTSSYIRAGDVIGHMLAGPAADTVWTMPAAPPPAPASPVVATAPEPTAAPAARGNDPGSGYIMAGRSPYFGLVLWLSWVASHFWLFVLLQATVAFFLIGLMLRCFGVDRPGIRLAVAAGLGLLTPLALYDGLLLADALSGFGIAAFLILAMPDARLAIWERAALVLLMVGSAISHLTHLVMFLGMAGVMVLAVLAKQLRWADVRGAVLLGAGTIVIGALSIIATSHAVKAHYGKAPVLVPLLTARFVADGPGLDYIRAGCGGRHFAVCTLPDRGWTSSTDFLWNTTPERGGFLLAPIETRLRMSEEDKAFATAVLAAHPFRVAGLAIWNTWLQMSDLRVDVIDESCLADERCIGGQFPASIVRQIAATPAGQSRWPLGAMNAVVYTIFLAALAALVWAMAMLVRRDPGRAAQLGLWVGLLVVAFLINGFLGGAVSEPQSRYQTRMAWLLPMMTAIALAILRARPAPLRAGKTA